MAVRIRKGEALSNVNLTPLIDVVFMLLIFFIVATEFAREEDAIAGQVVKEQQLDVTLPDASEAMPMTAEMPEIFITVSADGRFSVGKQAMTIEQLENYLTKRAINNPINTTAIIRSDKNAPTGATVDAINACKKAKIPNYHLLVRKPSEQE